ncbi:MAG: hypothetical protein Q9160_007996 [Pyrenula sp. 1 TL-2023]
MASIEEETASDCERRRARRRERRDKRAERHAKRASASPTKTNNAFASYPPEKEPNLRRERLPSTTQRHPESDFRTARDLQELPRTIDSNPSPPIEKPAPIELTYCDLNEYNGEYQQDLPPPSYDDRHARGGSGHHQRKERHNRHDRHDRSDHKKRQLHHDTSAHQYYDEKRRSHRSETLHRSFTDEYKTERDYDSYEDHSRKWSWKKKLLLIGVPIIIILIIILSVAIAVANKPSFKYTPSNVQVTNSSAFTNGGAAKDANVTDDGHGAGTDRYIYYSGPASNFPPKDEWVSFANMWTANMDVMKKSCSILGHGKDNSDKELTYIFNAIQSRASASLVDHRFILAVILQEASSHGCLRIPTTNNGIKNPGLMQSHNGASYSSSSPSQSILQMVQDGTQGTESGPGLAQHLDTHGNAYSAARMYNSGIIADDGDLSNGAGATACYASDIANRLTGWIYAKSTCPGATY